MPEPAAAGTPAPPAPADCDLPGCHAPRLPGRGRRYCCAAHTDAARNLANERARAAALERQALRDALDGKTQPPQHVGFLATSHGTVLTGQALVELRAAVGLLRSAAQHADSQHTGGLLRTQFIGRLREVRLAAERAAEAVEKVLPGS